MHLKWQNFKLPIFFSFNEIQWKLSYIDGGSVKRYTTLEKVWQLILKFTYH